MSKSAVIPAKAGIPLPSRPRSGTPAFAGVTNRIATIAAFILLVVAIPASAQTFPPLTGRVVDDAHILSPDTIADLTSKSEALERRTSDQLVVATVGSLGGQDIKTYAMRLANHWGVGQKRLDNGVVILVAPKEHKTRIAVGYGLEGLLTDARSAVVVQHMVPYFAKGQYGAGLKRGEGEITKILLDDPHRPRRILS